MKALFQSLLLLITRATDRELARQVQYLKAENEVLRGKLPERITVTPQERERLVKFGRPLGKAIKDLVSIVSPRTFLRWLQGEEAVAKGQGTRPAKPGRPRTPEDIRELVLKLARENSWGYTRILGELKKLGVGKISRSTVVNILKEAGLDPGPKRGEGTWDEFIKRHADTLIACDFFSQQVWTATGFVQMFVLFFIHLGSRRVHLGGITATPDQAWVVQQARNAAMHYGDQPKPPKMLLRDNDFKFVPAFDAILEDEGIEVKRISPHSPNLNCYAERFVQSIKGEALSHFLIFGERHLRYLISQYLIHYHQFRPHQGKGNMPLTGEVPAEATPLSVKDVVCEGRLGGLLKHYRRAG